MPFAFPDLRPTVTMPSVGEMFPASPIDARYRQFATFRLKITSYDPRLVLPAVVTPLERAMLPLGLMTAQCLVTTPTGPGGPAGPAGPRSLRACRDRSRTWT